MTNLRYSSFILFTLLTSSDYFVFILVDFLSFLLSPFSFLSLLILFSLAFFLTFVSSDLKDWSFLKQLAEADEMDDIRLRKIIETAGEIRSSILSYL